MEFHLPESPLCWAVKRRAASWAQSGLPLEGQGSVVSPIGTQCSAGCSVLCRCCLPDLPCSGPFPAQGLLISSRPPRLHSFKAVYVREGRDKTEQCKNWAGKREGLHKMSSPGLVAQCCCPSHAPCGSKPSSWFVLGALGSVHRRALTQVLCHGRLGLLMLAINVNWVIKMSMGWL